MADETKEGIDGILVRLPVELGNDVPTSLPQIGYVFEVQPRNSGFGLRLNRGKVWRDGAQGFVEALTSGVGFGVPNNHHNGRQRSALSVRLPRAQDGTSLDFYLGFVLPNRGGQAHGIEFTQNGAPFSGSSESERYFKLLSNSRVDARHAYMLVRGSQLTGDVAAMRFNIHIDELDRVANTVYRTPIIIDPDVRHPDGTEPQ